MTQSHKRFLSELPRVFQLENGNVNCELIESFYSTSNKLAKRVKELFRILSVNEDSQTSRLDFFCDKLTTIDFREKWYESIDKTTQKTAGSSPLIPLYHATNAWVSNKHPNLGFTSEVLKGFWEKKKEKTYPNLNNISLLTSQLIEVSKISLTDSALYAWSSIEHAQWSCKAQPTEISLKNFRSVLLADLKSRGADGILRQLEDGVFLKTRHSNNAQIAITCASTNFSQNEINTPKKNSALINIEPADVIELNKVVDDSLYALIGFMDKIANEHRQFTEFSKNFISLCDNKKSVADVILAMEQLPELIEQIEVVVNNTEERATDIIGRAIKQFGLSLAPQNFLKFSIARFDKWKEEITTFQEKAKQILVCVEKLKDFNEKLIKTTIEGIDSKEVDLECVVQSLSDIEEKLNINYQGEISKSTLQNLMSNNQEDISWNPILDPSISVESWVNLGKYLVLQEIMPRVLGICLRKQYSELQEPVAKLLDKYAAENPIRMDDAFNILGCLTLRQIEQLNCMTEKGIELLAVFELEMFLRIVNTASIEKFNIWSAKQLRQCRSDHPSTSLELFFKTLYEIVNIEVDKDLNLSELFRLTNLTVSKKNIEFEEIAQSFRSDLLTILQCPPGRGTTHTQLWELAHESICKPLQQIAEHEDIDTVADAVAELHRKFKNNIYLEDSLSAWNSTIPERLKKESSVYKNKLRLAVRGKLSELDDWFVEYTATKNSHSTPKTDSSRFKLKEIIDEICVSENTAGSVLRTWFKSISDTSQRLPVELVSLTESEGLQFNNELILNKIDPFYPRLFNNDINKINNTVSDYLGDELFINFEFYTSENLSRIYANQHFYEAFSALSAIAQESISIDLERRVEAEINELDETLSNRIETVMSQVGELERDDSLIISSSLNEVKDLISKQYWTTAKKELSDVEQTLLGSLKSKDNRIELQKLLNKIATLGGDTSRILSVNDALATFNKLFSETIDRRKHIEYIREKFIFDGMEHYWKEALDKTIEKLEMPENLPNMDRSNLIEYTFTLTLGILGEELKRSKRALPADRAKLRTLTLSVLNMLKEHGVNEKSLAILMLEESEPDWKLVQYEPDAIERLLTKFSVFIDTKNLELSEEFVNNAVRNQSILEVTPQIAPEDTLDSSGIISTFVDRLISAAERIGKNKSLTTPHLANVARDLFIKCDDPRSSLALGYLIDWSLLMLRENEQLFFSDEYAAVLHLINRFESSANVQLLLPSKSSKGRLGEITAKFLAHVALEYELEMPSDQIDQIVFLSEKIDQIKARNSLFFVAFSAFGKSDSATTRCLWDKYSSDTRQAEARAAFMNILWRTSVPTALACCLKYSPINIEARTAIALANVADQALTKGRVDLLHSYVDLLRTNKAKPFEIFVRKLQSKMLLVVEPSAQIKIVGPLGRIADSNKLEGILSIIPRRSDSPDSLVLKFPQSSSIYFDCGFIKTLTGPFFGDEIFVNLNFELIDKNAHKFSMPIDCEATSITGIKSSFTIRLDFEISGFGSDSNVSTVEIEDAFQHFQYGEMRGAQYVNRPDDERRIEDDLIKSTVIRSLWICSPRRSGKTSILYRVLDAYSHKVGRDNLVVYLCLTKNFESVTKFNEWIWRSLQDDVDNVELRNLFDNFSLLGKEVSSASSVGTFIETIATVLLSKSKMKATRIIFMFDEIDQLATMYFGGQESKNIAMEIAWELRRLINRSRNIGFIFAGSSAAEKIFLTNPEAPFFNSPIHYKLRPFSIHTKSAETQSREIVEPPRIRGKLQIPKMSLEHLIWICAGIPYYMKLLAGAAYAVTKHSHMLKSDVDEGLRALLERRTGVNRLDGMAGHAGADGLQTIALEKGVNYTLTMSVIYAMAELESPISGHPIRRAHLYNEKSPLVERFQLPRKSIEQSLDRAIQLGILDTSTDTPPQISFAIPMLGESIRSTLGSFWAEIADQLEQISVELNKVEL